MNSQFVKIGESAETAFILDHYFWSLVVSYIGGVPNVRGAIDAKHWTVAFITMKELLHDAVSIYLYINGWKTPANSLHYMYEMLEETLCDNALLFNEIKKIELSNLEDCNLIEYYANRAIEISYELIPQKYIEYYYSNNAHNFEKHLETAVKLDVINESISQRLKFSFPPSINRYLLEVSRKINNSIS
jgi:hypothetical protein